ncbi:class I SAM-dependent methyltransferase [Phormidium tenue FACHB-886]|nr:class I SAM-dependent methyltransferase [Phormidium tenue FACHB-886]
MAHPDIPCLICRTPAAQVGVKRGKWRSQEYVLYRCPHCSFAFVGNPSTDYDQIYTLEYYKGQGADPLTDYFTELEQPKQTIRRYEWRGITSIVSQLQPLTPDTTWLDFGCGNGGLVRWVQSRQGCNIVGFEEGAIAEVARSQGIPILTAEMLAAQENCYDVITAIEVLEHVDDPIGVLKQLFGLLKPGGVFFYTTGNAAPHADRLVEWGYVVPEIHISFYEPATLEYAMTNVGFSVQSPGYLKGFTDVIRFKVLKNLGLKQMSWWEKLLPWSILSPLIDRRYGVSAFPVGRKGKS